MSVDWCKQDASFLLSSGKNNRTYLWDPLSGEKVGEYPVTSNWNFQTSFSPRYPDIFASASFDGKISIQTLQDTNSSNDSQKKSEGDDFWSSNNYIDSQHPTVSLKKAPKWLQRPVSTTFGFGGKIVSVEKTGDKQSIVKISKMSGDESLISETSKLATALESNSISDIIADQLSESKGAEHFDWSILELISKDGDKKDLLKKYISSDESKKAKEDDGDEKKESKDDDLFGDGTTSEDDFLGALSLSKYQPSGPFSIYKSDYDATDKAITKAILSGNLEKAIDIAIKEDRLSDAFAIASRSTEATRIKVQNAYLSKHAESKPYLRLLHSIDSNDLSDIVENSDANEWKDILGTIISVSSDPAVYKKQVTALGERLIQARVKIPNQKSDEAVELRNSAVLCFLAAESLSNVSKLWISEISEKESFLLSEEAEKLTPYSAHVKALHSFIEKITIFRKTALETDASAADKNDDLARLYDVYRDYANIVATQGQLSLAETYLNLVPAQYLGASLERERVLKANSKDTKPVTATNAFNKGSTRAPGVNSNFTYPGKPLPAVPFGASAAEPTFGGASPSPYNLQATSNPAARTASPYAPAKPYAPLSHAQPNSLYAPATNSLSPNPPVDGKSFQPGHARGSSGIFTPSNPIMTPYQPHNAHPRDAPPPPPSVVSTQTSNKNLTGWNDLPPSAVPPPRKVTPAVPITQSPLVNPSSSSSSFSAPSGPPQFGRQTPAPPLAPPPVGAALKPSTPSSQQISPSNTSTSVSANPPSINSRYAPASSPQTSRSNLYGPPQGAFGADQLGGPFGGPLGGQRAPAPVQPPTNPYANLASAPSQPAPSPYAPAPQTQFQAPPQAQSSYGPSSNGYGPPQAQSPYGPPSNSYAPSQQQAPSQTSSYAPPQQVAPPPTNSQYAPVPAPQQQQQQQSFGYQSGTFNAPVPGPETIQATSQAPPAPEPAQPPARRYPPGDREHIPESSRSIYNILSEELQSIAPHIPDSYRRQFEDAGRRINILFDHLNNEDLLSEESITDMTALVQALQSRDYDTASEIRLSIQTTRTSECESWMVGVKRLIEICKILAQSGAR